MTRPKRDVLAAIEDTLIPPPSLTPSQSIARITKVAGKNIFGGELPDGKQILVELIAIFRSRIWIKRGSFVVVDLAKGKERDNKLDGEIVNVVREEREWRKMAYWPKKFAKKSTWDDDNDEEDDAYDNVNAHVGRLPPSSDEEDDDA